MYGTSTSNALPAICARIDTTDLTGYCVSWQGGVWSLWKYISGTPSDLASTSTSLDIVYTTRTVKLSVRGSTIAVTVDATPIYSVTDNTITAAGRAGVASLYTDASEYRYIDNWRVDNPPSTTPVRRRVVADE